jgi:hypothetical protein
MAEESEKKKEASIGETPEVEKPPVLAPETHVTPSTPPSPVFEKLTEKAEEKPSCQWFMNDMEFCDKIKKKVRCGGDIRKCPF